jgi:DNA-binding LacI/PurR family transcriptional regulator
MHNKGRISQERRDQIQQIARDLKYYPRSAAQLLRSNQTGFMGILVSSRDPERGFAEGRVGRILGQFIRWCEKHEQRYHVEFCHGPDYGDAIFEPPRQITGGQVDGTLVVGDVGDDLRQWMADQSPVPWVSVCEPGPLSVMSADGQGARQAVEYLASLGHTRIACSCGPVRFHSQRLRRDGFLQGIKQCGLELVQEDWLQAFEPYRDRGNMEKYMQWCRQLLAQSKPPTAMMGIALGPTYAALERGMRIPEDLSLIDWMDVGYGNIHYQPMTLLQIDDKAIVEHATDLLQQQLRGEKPEQPVRWVEQQFIIGQSTAPAHD